MHGLAQAHASGAEKKWQITICKSSEMNFRRASQAMFSSLFSRIVWFPHEKLYFDQQQWMKQIRKTYTLTYTLYLITGIVYKTWLCLTSFSFCSHGLRHSNLVLGHTNFPTEKKELGHFRWEIKSKTHSQSGFGEFDVEYLLNSNGNETKREKSNTQQTLFNSSEADKSLIGLFETSKRTNTSQSVSKWKKNQTKSYPTDAQVTDFRITLKLNKLKRVYLNPVWCCRSTQTIGRYETVAHEKRSLQN